MPSHVAPHRRRPGELLIRVGAGFFGVGVVAVLLVLVPFLAGSRRDAPLPLGLVALALPVGFGLALIGLLRGARSHQ